MRALGFGGAERQLVVLATGLHEQGHEISVATFYPGGPLEKELLERGIAVIDLRKSGRWDIVSFFARLTRIVRKLRPQVIYGFMGSANIVTAVMKPVFPGINMVWGVRASNVDLERYDWLARLSYRIECKLARVADLIICNSRAGFEYAATHGFPKQKMIVVHNGVDTDHFRPDSAARRRTRAEWGISDNELLIGLIGRLDPMKDHFTFLKGASILARNRPDVRFVCVGDGPADYQAELRRVANEYGLGRQLIWAGARRDMLGAFNALDIAVSSSSGEGFSNVIAEAMACGVPCVVTDVGDSAMIVAETGCVVPPSQPNALYEGLRLMLLRLGSPLRATARESVVSRFNNGFLVRDTGRALDGMRSAK